MPGFDLSAARKAGYSDDEILKHLTETRKFDIAGALNSGYSKSDIITYLAGSAAPSAASPQHWSDRMGLDNPWIRGAVDLAEGATSGLASTVFHGGDLIRRGLGMERVIDRPEVQQAMAAPPSIPGQVGKFAEQTAELAIPGAAIAKAGKAAQLGLAGRAALEGAFAGGAAAAQTGGDPVATATGAVLGAGVPALGGVGTSRLAPYFRRSAEKQYAQAINATKQGNKWISQNIAVPELLDRGVAALTLKGLKGKASSAVQRFGQAIDDAWGNLAPGTKVELDPILANIEKNAADGLTIAAADGSKIAISKPAEQALQSIDYLKKMLRDVAEYNPTTGRLEVPAEKLRSLRQAWDEVAAAGKRYEGKELADAAIAKIHGKAADAIRQQLAADFPNIAALNKEYSFWRNVEQVTKDTILRREGQAKPLSQRIAGAGGMAVGGATGGLRGAVMGKQVLEGLTALTNSTAWKTTSAVLKNKLAYYLARGNTAGAASTVRQMLKAAGMETAIKAQADAVYAPFPALASGAIASPIQVSIPPGLLGTPDPAVVSGLLGR